MSQTPAPSNPAGFDADDADTQTRLRALVRDAAGALYATFDQKAIFEAESNPNALAAFQAKLGHDFTNPWLLHASLTHKSFRAESTSSGLNVQSLLAWIGDAALQSIVSDELLVRYGGSIAAAGAKVQAALTVARTQVVSRSGCAHNGRVLGLDAPGLILLGQSYKGQGVPISKDMLGETFEAVVGAVVLDGGRAAARAAFLKADPFPARLMDLAGAYAA